MSDLDFEPLPWMKDASCKNVPSAVFFPEKGKPLIAPAGTAQKICNGDRRKSILPCPVRDQCLAYALSLPRMHGIWGGTNYEERERIRRSQGL